MSLYRAEKLIDLACSTTHEEEARTAALAACRLIRRHGLRLTGEEPRAATHPSGRRGTATSAAQTRTPPRPARAKPPNGGVWVKTKRSGRCDSCGDAYAAGEDAYEVDGAVWCASH